MVIKNEHFPGTDLLLLGVDGGGTRCRARLPTSSGKCHLVRPAGDALEGALRLAGAAAGRASGHACFPRLERG
jgi:N-acetylglucosamine kinase-like BadF-type ATPase